jgi:Thiolase, C-terminal domain
MKWVRLLVFSSAPLLVHQRHDCHPGVGPAVAIPKALQLAGLTVADIDVFEINEAFASQVWRVRALSMAPHDVSVVSTIRLCTVCESWAFPKPR